MASSVKVTFDRAHFAAKMKNAKEGCGKFMAEQIIGDSIPFTPRRQGNIGGTLEDSARVEKVGEDYAATWNTAYAAYQWYGCWPDGSHVIKNHDRFENTEATTQWVEAAKKRYGKDWEIVARKEHVKNAK